MTAKLLCKAHKAGPEDYKGKGPSPDSAVQFPGPDLSPLRHIMRNRAFHQ
jgi:hypothetical protein